MRVGVFCPTLGVYGGGEFVAVALANTLAQSNHQVTLFSSRPVDAAAIKNYFGELLHPTIQSIVQPTRFNLRELADFYQTIVHSYAAKHRCDIFLDAFSNCIYPWTDISYIHYPYLNRDSFNRRFPYLMRPRIMQAATTPHVLLEKKLMDYNSRLILANSRYTAAEIKAFSGKTAEVLYPPYPSTITEQAKTAAKNPTENLVVTTSRFEYNKQLERIPLIAAQTDRNVQFAVIGRLYTSQTLQNLQKITKQLGLSDRVRFYPNASSTLKLDLLKRAKVYLHTMVGEHFGISIVEAMALGCVPVVHDSGGMREFVPADNRYTTVAEAAQKISSELDGWSTDKAKEAQAIAERFSLPNFSARFMALFNKHYN